MRTYNGMFWEHWNQSRLWIVGAASFLFLMTCGVWLNHDWVMREFRNDPFELDKFAWVVGFTAVCLMFVNYRMREVNLYFPRRQFALPCRTVPLVLSHLLFKSAVAVGLGLIIALYHAVLFEQSLSPLAVFLFLALVAITQALVLVATLAGPWLAAGAGALTGWAVFLLYLALGGSRIESDAPAVYWTCAALTVLGWAASLVLAPLARRGVSVARAMDGARPGSRLRAWAPVTIQWSFAAPFWAHAWHEWRRVVCWVPRVAVPTSVICVVLMMNREGEFALLLLAACVAFPAVLCSYFLFRLSPSEARFILARPGAFQALVDGKLVAAFVATAVTVLISVTVLELIGASAREFGGRRAANWHTDYWVLYPMGACALWITLTSAPVFMAGTGLWFLFVLLVVAPIAGLAGVFLPLGWIAGAAALAIASLGLRHLARRGIPIPWELSLVTLAFLPNALVWWISGDIWTFERTPLPFRAQLELFSPLLLLWGGLFFARRVGAITWRRLERSILVHLLLVLLLAVVILLMSRTLDDMKDRFFLFWWLAACFGPVVWLPLALHAQRYR